MKMNELNKKIRQVKQQLINNLDYSFNPVDVELDAILGAELSQLYDERKRLQNTKLDTLSEMYLRIYA